MPTLSSTGRRTRTPAALCLALFSTACGGGGDHPTGATVEPTPTIAVAGPPAAALAVGPGGSATATVVVSRGGGYGGAVDLVVSDLPAGITATLAPSKLGPEATQSVITTAAAAGVAPGSYTFTVAGTGAGVREVRTTIPVTVARHDSAAAAIALSGPPALAITRGATATATLALVRTGFAGDVTLTADNLPAGVTATFAPSTLSGSTATATLTLDAATGAAAGAHAVAVRARGAGVDDATTVVPLTVTAPAAALAVAAPAALSVAQGAAGAATITFTRANFTGDVTVSLENAPAGISAESVSVPASASSAVLGLRVAAGAATGARPLTVRLAGPGGEPTAAATLTLTVTAAPAAPAAKLDGVYLGLATNGLTGRVYEDYWTFFPDGRMMRKHPSEGLARPTNYDAVCARFECGTYEVRGAELYVRWAFQGQEKVYDLDAEGSFAERGRITRYRPLAPLTGLRLGTRYAVIDHANDIVLTRVEFTSGGRFTETNLMTHTSWASLAPPGETRVPLRGGAGAYTITRNTLELRYDGGPTAYFFFVIPPGQLADAAPDVVYINTAHIKRVP